MTTGLKRGQHLIEREDCALVIIDVQEKLMPAISNRERVVENVLRLVRFSKIVGVPVVVTEQEKLGATVSDVKKELGAIEPIAKVHFNCFSCNDFTAAIEKLGRNTLILTGVEAHICVTQTALFALPHFTVHTIRDAVSSRTAENHLASIERMRQCGATISSTEMFIYEILQRAGTDEFKTVLQLVK
jgi:nicotinamidase-related amidase